ncbi:Phage tail protein [Phytophthora palmivora]|uniref:Phage tail protein n=1 Tax=Phytophthora palmivora TaxID=4796 RepID=A0A2P4X3I0_9STRA|nr:Phage tail protein [Phytophthora palmivora]
MLNALKKRHHHACRMYVGDLKREYMTHHIRHTSLILGDSACYKMPLMEEEKKNNFLQSLGPD